MKRHTLLPFLLPVLAAGCGDGPTEPLGPPPVSSVVVIATTPTLQVGQTQQLLVSTLSASGDTLTGRTVSWSTSDAAVATVSTAGLVTAVSPGSVTITATSEGRSGTAVITVTPVPVALLVVSPATVMIQPWQTAALTAIAYDSAGNVLPGRSIKWSSTDSMRVAVDTAGTVTANLLGTVEITATSEGRAASASVRVMTPSPVWVSQNVNVAGGSETSIAINPTNPLNIVVSSNFVHNYSFDGGRTWTSTSWQGIAPAAETDPTVSFDHQGVLYRQGLSLFTSPRHLYVDVSTDGGKTLTRQAAYQPTLSDGNPDQGILTVDTVSASPYRGTLYVLFSDYPNPPSPECRGFCLRVIASRDGGRSWNRPVDVSDEAQFMQEHSSYITTGPHGEVYVAWWNLENKIMFAQSLDGGQTWSPNVLARQAVNRSSPFPLSDEVRGNVTIDVDRSAGPFRGRIYISAVDFNGPFGGAADAWAIHSADGGMTWSDATLLSDGPRGEYRYYFQPRISVAPNGRVDAIWYDTRNGSGGDINNVTYDVYYSSSTDGGSSFTNNVQVTSLASTKQTSCPNNSSCGQRILFEYIGLASENTRSLAAWTDLRTGSGRVFVAVIWHTP